MEKRKTTQHRMTRRAAAHDYSAPGLYHITLHVAEALGQPLGHRVPSSFRPASRRRSARSSRNACITASP